jgi:hypothetical protein
MGRRADAIGFAVYPDLLQHLQSGAPRPAEADVLLLYTERDDARTVCRAVRSLMQKGLSVRCATAVPEKADFGRILHLTDVKE